MKGFSTTQLSSSSRGRIAALVAAFAIMLVITAPLQGQSVTATLNPGIQPQAVAVNPVTNKIYVAVVQGAAVIDGATGAITTVTAGSNPQAIALNPATNKIYVVNELGGTVTVIAGATDTATATVTVGTAPFAVAVNPVTNKIYVPNRASNSVTVIDGATNTPTNVDLGPGGGNPQAVAVNPVTNKIYVVEAVGVVAVLNGTDNSFANVTVGTIPVAAAVNPITNKIYVVNSHSNTVTVINGADNSTATVSVGTAPNAVAVNPVTNKVYVTNATSNNMTVIDGATNGTTTVKVGTLPDAVAVDALTNQIYVGNNSSNTVTVVDGATNTPGATALAVGTGPVAIGVNPVTNRMYVANHGNTVSVIDGAVNATNLVTVGAGPLAVDMNPATNKIYVANSTDGTVTVIDGATNGTTPVTVGTNPHAVAVNPLTNQIYVGNQDSADVTVIDGATNAATTISLPAGTTCPCATGPTSVAVDTVTNRIYVANDHSNTVTVIDGASNAATAVTAGTGPNAIAVDPAGFKIYVANRGSSNVTVIDGTDSSTSSAGAGTFPESIAVIPGSGEVFAADNGGNDISFIFFGQFQGFMSDAALNLPQSIAANPASSQIWVANNGSNTATVFAGANGAAFDVTVGNNPDGLSINAVNNKVYVSNFTDSTISVINGDVLTPVLSGTAGLPVTLTAGTHPGNSVANPITSKTYVTNFTSGNVTIITEQNSQAIPLTTTISPLAGNQTASTTPTFTFTTSSTYSPNAPTPQSVYFQIDTWQGPWLAASGANPTFTAATPALTLGPHIIYAFASDGQSQDSEGSGTIGQIQSYSFNVVRNSSSTALTSSKNPSGNGESVTFTATVTTASGTPTGQVAFFDGTTTLGNAPLSGGQASFNTSSLTQGNHSITATYSGDSSFAGSTSPVLSQVVLAFSTTLLVSGPNPSLPGQAVTLTASVTGSGGTPTGTVSFMDSASTLGTGTLSSGQAVFVTSALVPGSHTLTAVYGGDTNFASSTSAVVTQVVVSTTTTAVVSSVNPSALNQSVTFTATVSSSGGTPTGAVTFDDGAVALGTATLSSGQASFSISSLALGSHSITVVYGGDANFQGSKSPALNQAVLGTTTTGLVSSINPSASGQPVTFTASVSASGAPTGTVTFKDGAATMGTVALSGGQAVILTSSLSLGSHSITAVYGGDSSFAGSTSPPLTQSVKTTSTVALTSNVNPSGLSEAVNFTASVSASGGTPTGTVSFTEGPTILGTGTLAAGQATVTITTLTPGSHSMTAVYGGDSSFLGSTSPTLTQTVTSQPPDFGVSTSSANATVIAGQSTTLNFTVTPNNGFMNTISFSCSGQPAGVTCSFNPQTVTPNGTSAVATVLTISTTTSVASLRSPSNYERAASLAARYPLWLPGAVGLVGLLLVGGRNSQHQQRKKSKSLLLGLMLGLVLGSLAGCGGHQSKTVMFNVIASSGGASHSTTVTLTIRH